MARQASRSPVLVLARDPLLAALVGVALALGDFEPVFAEPGERPEDALDRLLPPFVVLLDGALEEAGSDLFAARVARHGARLVLFAPPGDRGAVRTMADERGVPYVELPGEGATLHDALAAALDRGLAAAD